MQDAQRLDNHLGKVVRVSKDGSAGRRTTRSSDRAGALPEIWSYGHRNSQGRRAGAGRHASGCTSTARKGGDEINVPQPGRNYGWPVIT